MDNTGNMDNAAAGECRYLVYFKQRRDPFFSEPAVSMNQSAMPQHSGRKLLPQILSAAKYASRTASKIERARTQSPTGTIRCAVPERIHKFRIRLRPDRIDHGIRRKRLLLTAGRPDGQRSLPDGNEVRSKHSTQYA